MAATATLTPSPAVVPTTSAAAALTLANVLYEKKGAIAYVTVSLKSARPSSTGVEPYSPSMTIQERPMASDNIFSGLKVVDLASFVAGPGAAVILSDFGADVIKVEPPSGDMYRIVFKLPPQPRASDNYTWHLDNRNKRGLALDLKSPNAAEVLERLVKWADVLIVNTPHPARERLKLEYQDVVQWNPRLIYADISGFGDNGPDANLPGFDVTAYWSRSGLLSQTRDAGAPPTCTGVSARAKAPMSRHRYSPRASGPLAPTLPGHWPGRPSIRCTIGRARRTRSSIPTRRLRVAGSCWWSRRINSRRWRPPLTGRT